MMPEYLGTARTVADLEALIAAYGGPLRRRVSVRVKALVLRYLERSTVRTPAEARLLGLEDERRTPWT